MFVVTCLERLPGHARPHGLNQTNGHEKRTKGLLAAQSFLSTRFSKSQVLVWGLYTRHLIGLLEIMPSVLRGISRIDA
jgi:hypothetical protein